MQKETDQKLKKKEFFDSIAPERPKWRRKSWYYHKELANHLRFLIPEGASVLEIGTETGDLLASLKPRRGVGVDLSEKILNMARERYPYLEFRAGDLDSLDINETFDYVVLANVIGYVDDIQNSFNRLKRVCRPDTRVIVVYYNHIWRPALTFMQKLGLRMNWPEQHWLSVEDLENILHLSDFEVIKKKRRFLIPFYIPFISTLFNRYIVNLPFFGIFALNHILIAHPWGVRKKPGEAACSVVVPCRNEKGNIEQVAMQIPSMGKHTEIIFVEGHSSDGTLEECRRIKAKYPGKNISVFTEEKRGKWAAVQCGFRHAKGDVLMIFDADLTTPAESLPYFFDAIVYGRGEFINGSRLIYRMEKQAMRFLNMLGNKFFSILLTYLLDQYLKDTLCGTKVLWREDYEKIEAGQGYFGHFDPFGDFNLLFGATKLNLKIVEIPVHYKERVYGTTNIRRFQHGWLLLCMSLFAMKKIKFI